MGYLSIICIIVYQLLSKSFPMFVGIRFFVGGSIHAVWCSYFVLMAELVPASKRSLVGGVLNFGWQIGSLIMTLTAYLLRRWNHMQFAFAGNFFKKS